jgi:hypothetical protein
MSDEQEMAAIGRIVTEYAQARRQLAKLDEEAVTMAKTLGQIAEILKDRQLVINAGKDLVRGGEAHQSFTFPVPPSAEGIYALVRSIGETQKKIDRLAGRVRELGLV